jgi:hypothetical protein
MVDVQHVDLAFCRGEQNSVLVLAATELAAMQAGNDPLRFGFR